MNRIVCDTNTLVSGLLWNGTPARVVDRTLTKRDKLFVSKKLLAELADVLCRPKFVYALEAAGTTPKEIISVITEVAILIVPKPLGETVIPNDPSDEEVLACAVTADARVIVSGDKKHLLPLRTYRGIRIVTAKEYLAQVK